MKRLGLWGVKIMMQQPKTYADFMNEISPSEIYEGLLAYGLFAEQLPPILTGKPFFDYCQNHSPTFPKTPASYIIYESIRNINVPRPLGIPNPVAYRHLCRCISTNWVELQSHFQTTTKNHSFTVSRIHVRKMKDTPSLFKMNYKDWRVDGTPEPDLLIGSKYSVKADISNCFPSIYSHALSWALVGKDVAKKNKSNHSQWYNELDLYTRNAHDGETHGLIIGPHASNLLSEIILTKIDQNLYDEGWRYTRNIDDYSCYVDTYEGGQKFLVSLNEQLRQYGLTLNHKKTSIDELPAASIEQWVRRINAFSAFDKEKFFDFKVVQAYLDLAVDLMQENGSNSAILKYAIKVLSKKRLSQNANEYYVKTVLHLALIYPYLVTLLQKHVFSVFSVAQSTIKDFSQKLIDYGISSRNYESACFAVYFAIVHDFILNGIEFDNVKDTNNCIFLLLCFLYQQRLNNTAEVKEYKNLAVNLQKTDMDAYWLFVYEVLPQSKLKEYWKDMKKQGVSFVKI